MEGQTGRREKENPALGRRKGFLRRLLAASLAAAALLALAGCSGGEPREPKEGAGHFLREDAVPALSEEGVKCAIVEAFYTNDGGLMLKLKLSNGTDSNRRLLTLDVVLENEDGEEIAVAATDQISGEFYVPAGGYGNMEFYISPEYLKKTDDDLDTLTYEIRVTSEAAEETTATQA